MIKHITHFFLLVFFASSNSASADFVQDIINDVPDAPNNVRAEALASDQIAISWEYNDEDEKVNHFLIERADESTLGGFKEVHNVNKHTRSVIDDNLQAQTTYQYRVLASNPDGNSDPSSIVEATTLLAAPNAPTNLTANGLTGTSIRLSWEHDMINSEKIVIERSNLLGSFSEVGETSVENTTYDDENLLPLVVYNYRVKAVSATEESSEYSNTASSTTALLATAPNAPSGLAAPGITSNSVTLSWTDNSDNEDNFIVEKATVSTGPFTTLATLAPDITTTTDTDVSPNTTYYYQVKAINGVDDSEYTAVLEVTTLDVAPAVPSGLTASPASTTSISLQWTDNSSNEDNFILERSATADGTYTPFTLAANLEEYSDTGLDPNTTYYYKIKALNAAGSSVYTDIASAKTNDVAPVPPSVLQVTAKTASTVSLAWTDASDNELYFILERSSTSATTGFTKIVERAANATTYLDDELAPNTTYWYRIKAHNAAGDSEYSGISVTTNDVPAKVPTALVASAISTSSIKLTWTDNANNEDNYVVERSSTGGEGTFTVITSSLAANTNTFTNSGLKSNTTYYYRVKAVNEAGSLGYSAQANATTSKDLPTTPSELRSTVVTASTITLIWNDNSGNETGFVLERSLTTEDEDFSIVANIPANNETYTDEGLSSNTTYFYRIRAKNADGFSETYSNEPGITTEREAGPPAAPTKLTAHAVTTFLIKLEWQDNADNETSYIIERYTDPENITKINLPSNTEVYENIGLSANTTYYYKVIASNNDGVTESNIVSATTLANAQPPTAPTALSASAVSTVQINLRWTDNSDSEANFIIERSTTSDPESFKFIAAVNANITEYQNFGLSPDTRYYYRVQAQNQDGPSIFSNTANAKTSQSPQPPAAPSSIQATGVSTAQINITWIDNSDNESGFEILRAESQDGAFGIAGIVGVDKEVFQNTGLNSNTTYYYKVRAINQDGASAFTSTVSAATSNTRKPPVSPSSLTATGVSTGQINLSWIDNSDSETGFEIQRGLSLEGPFTFVALTAGNVTTYESTGLSPNVTYFYQVRATNTDGNSTFTNIANATTLEVGTPPMPPTGLTALGVSRTQINLSWQDNSENETEFEIERSIGDTLNFEIVQAGLNANDTTYENTGLTPGTNYFYRLRAVNGDGKSTYSNYISAFTLEKSTPPAPPSDLYGIAQSQTAIELFWTDNSNNEIEFILERAEESNGERGTFNPIEASISSNSISYVNTGLSSNTKYWYRIKAVNEDGESTYSESTFIITSVGGKDVLVLLKSNFPQFYIDGSENITISITVAEPQDIQTMVFKYKGIAATKWEEKNISTDNNEYEIQVTQADLDQIGIEYYFEAIDELGNPYVSPVGYTYLRYEETGIVLDKLKSGETVQDYQMISIPLDLDQKNIVNVLEDDLGPYDPSKWRLFHFEDTIRFEKGDFANIEPGKGYWLIIKEKDTLDTGAGNVVEVTQDKPFELQLKKGWNQIGNPYMIEISWNEVLLANENSDFIGPLRTYNGSYSEDQTLGVFQGAYVHADQDVKIIFPIGVWEGSNEGRYTTSSERSTSTLNDTKGWNINFSLSSGNLNYNLGGLGMHSQAKESKDRFDRIALPRFLDYIDVNFEHPEYFSPKFTKDVVPLQESFIWDMIVVSSLGNTPVTVSWQKTIPVPVGMNLVLFDVEKQKPVDMRGQNSYKVAGEDVKLQVYYGDDEFIEEHLNAYFINIGEVFPNPFSEEFLIPVSLPASESSYVINVKIYNSIGNQVVPTYDFTVEDGFHEIKLHNNPLQNLNKGLYFYKITIGQKDKTLKEASGRIIKK